MAAMTALPAALARCIVRIVRSAPCASGVLAGALLAAATPASAGAAPEAALPQVTWYTFNLPPLYIAEGPRKGQGVVDLALSRQLIPRLPGYQHRTAEVPMQRMEKMLEVDPLSCALGLFKNAQREKTMLFSRSVLVQIPPGVLVKRSLDQRIKPYLDARGRLSLTRLLAQGELVVGVTSARSYGAPVDALLAKYVGKPNLFVNKTASPVKSLLTMTAVGRVDVVPAYPTEAAYLAHEAEGVKELRFYPLAEQPDYLLGHAACSRTPAGEKLIQRINDVLSRPDVRDAIAGYYDTWLDEQSRTLAHQLRSAVESR